MRLEAIGKHFLLFSITLGLAFENHAQDSGHLDFKENEYDFGRIKEANGPVTHRFTFINRISDSVKIKYVKASCGCTTPDWTREKLSPGDTGFVDAQYNPFNRPGPFNKTLTVMITGEEGSPYYLKIKGLVEPRPRGPKDDFPYTAGNLRSQGRTFNFGQLKIPLEQEAEPQEWIAGKPFKIYNQSDKPMIIKSLIRGPGHIALAGDSIEIAPRSEGSIMLTYNALDRKKLGFHSDNIVLATNDPLQPEKEYYVLATVLEYFPEAAEGQPAPKLKFDRNMIDFGAIDSDDLVDTEFILSNIGDKTLKIRDIQSNCACVVTHLNKYELVAGDSTTLKVHMTGKGRRGLQQKAITIFSNDPQNPSRVISVKAKVKE